MTLILEKINYRITRVQADNAIGKKSIRNFLRIS